MAKVTVTNGTASAEKKTRKPRVPKPVNAEFALEIENSKTRLKALSVVGKMAVQIDKLDVTALDLLANHIGKRKISLLLPPPPAETPAPQSF